MEDSQRSRLSQSIEVDGVAYPVEALRRYKTPADAPRLLVVSRLLNHTSLDLLITCLRAIECFTSEPHEIWVIDNHSRARYRKMLRQLQGINLIFNTALPLPPGARGLNSLVYRLQRLTPFGSYENAVALELASRIIEPESQWVMTLHMDTMPCRSGWLSYLLSKMNTRVRAAGVRMDRVRSPEGTLHILGCLFDFQLFRQLNLSFLPDLPDLDTGDRITIAFRQSGYGIFAAPNSLWQPRLVEQLPANSPFRSLDVDRSFDDRGNIFFLHLGRGVRKSNQAAHVGVAPKEWIEFANEWFFAGRCPGGLQS